MKKVMLISCGHFMNMSAACPGDWKCFKAAEKGEGKFTEPAMVTSFIRCECPGRAILPNVMATIKMSDNKPDAIMMTSCMAVSKPECPTLNMDMMSKMLQEKTGLPVIMGTHEY